MRSRKSVLAAVVAVVMVIAGGALWWWVSRERALDAAAGRAVTAYVDGWRAKSLAGVPLAEPAQADAYAAALAGMGAAPVTARAGAVARDGARASADVDVTWTLPGEQSWSYRIVLPVSEQGERWVVDTPAQGSLWHPDLGAADTMRVESIEAKRGNLLDRSGAPLMPMGDVYPVMIDPVHATVEGVTSLESIVGASPGSLVEKLTAAQAASSQATIPVITYRQDDFAARKAALDALPGVLYPRSQQPLASSRTFGQPLLGAFGPVTAEMVEQSNGLYVATDRAGLSGLQGRYDVALRGTPGVKVMSSTDTVLFAHEAVAGVDVQTTLSPSVQRAAETALAGVTGSPAALVALDVTSGEVLAVANTPTDGFNRALSGRYPAGSTFKVASSYAFLTKGLVSPSTPMSCPPTAVVDGRSFRNYEGESAGEGTFARNFAISCNTSIVSLAQQLGPDDLTQAAGALGVGGSWADQVGAAEVFAGSVPSANGATDQVAAAIGQGRVEVSPLSLAVMAGSVARGSFVPPLLVKDPPAVEAPAGGAASTGSPAGAASGSPAGAASGSSTPSASPSSSGSASPSPAAAPVALDAGAISALRDMMTMVVNEGTGQVLKGVTGGQVSGKTGTAEYGTDTPPKTRAWFMGYQGDVAFAVLVEEGSSGGSESAPVAKAFLEAYRAG